MGGPIQLARRAGRAVHDAIGSRVFAVGATVLLIGATLSPLLRSPGDDGFPLSTYPMFATYRPTELEMSYALGMTATGERRTLRPTLVGSGEVLQAFTIVARAVGGGAGPSQALCKQIAKRLAASERDDDREITTVRIVTGKHDAMDVLLRDRLGHETEKTRCAVRR